MEEVLREPFQRTSCYFNCGRSSSQRRFSNHNWWLHSYRSWSGNTKPQELKRSWYWLCHVCRSHQAWWWEATRQASPLGKALSAFWKLDRVWTSRASLQQKMQLFIASALSVLLYGCESWVLTSDLCRQIDSFQTSCIRIILGISRTYHVSNEEVYDRTGTVPLSQSVEARQTRFLGQFSSAPLGGPYFSKYGLHHPTHGKPRPGGCKILFHEYAAKLINPENPSLLHEIRTLAPDGKAWKRMEIDCGTTGNPHERLSGAERDIHNIVAKTNKLLGLLKRTCPLITDVNVRRTLYLSLARSQLSYATQEWSPNQYSLKAENDRVQRRAA